MVFTIYINNEFNAIYATLSKRISKMEANINTFFEHPKINRSCRRQKICNSICELINENLNLCNFVFCVNNLRTFGSHKIQISIFIFKKL